MKWSQWLANWDMTSLKISAPFMEMEWSPQEADKDAASLPLSLAIIRSPIALAIGEYSLENS